MSESNIHIALVGAIVCWIESYTDFYHTMAILVDFPDRRGCTPPNIGGNVPDVFASSTAQNFALIGEAKTAADIETTHSRNQLMAYLTFLARFNRSLLILAVPWHCTNQMRSLVRFIQRRTNTEHVTVQVLDRLPG